MLSLVGSLQADPFSLEHVATAGDTTSRQPRASSSQQKPSEPRQATLPEVPAVLDESDIDDDDPFKALGRTADEAAAREAAKKLEEADAKAEKKRLKKLKKEAGLAAEAPTETEQGGQSETALKRKKKKKSKE
jgi:DNA-directed RNA polymerase I subunit RPA43